MGPFSRRAKGEAGGEYIKRLRFSSIGVENCGAPTGSQKPTAPLYSLLFEHLTRAIFWRGTNRAKQILSKKKIFGVPAFGLFKIQLFHC